MPCVLAPLPPPLADTAYHKSGMGSNQNPFDPNPTRPRPHHKRTFKQNNLSKFFVLTKYICCRAEAFDFLHARFVGCEMMEDVAVLFLSIYCIVIVTTGKFLLTA